MKLRNWFGLFLSVLVLVAAGCGSDNNGGGSSGAAVSGVAAKGPILGGTVKAFEVISSATANPRTGIPRVGTTAIATATTSATDGSYALGLPITKGSVVVQVTGGTYKDEATGATLNVADQFGATGLRAVFGNISGAVKRGTAISAAVTPFTEIAYQNAAATRLTDAQIKTSNQAIATTYGLAASGVDVVGTTPLDGTKVFPASATNAQKVYTTALAGFSQYLKDSAKTGAQAITDFVGNLTGSAALLATSTTNWGNSLLNPNNAPATVTIAPAGTATVSTTGPLTVSATVKNAAGALVPNGTSVAFTTTFPAATATLSAATATTTNGVATVTLNGVAASTTTGTVTATAGTATATTGAITAIDPNAPGKVTLTAAPSPVGTGATVTLTAKVFKGDQVTPVADGVTVHFAITSGTGTLSAATSNTAGGTGTASVTVTSATVGSVAVSATAGSAVGNATAQFIAQPTTAVVTVAISGTLPTGVLIGGTEADIAFSATKGLGAPTSAKLALGSSADLFAANTTANPVKTGAAWASGTATGPLQTLTFPIAAGNFPTAADFSVAGTSSVIDTNNNPITGVSVTITSVVIQ